MKSEMYNIYCDESRVENLDADTMVIGAFIIPRSKKEKIVGDLKRICEKYQFHHELKWAKVGLGFQDFYFELVEYFFSLDCLQFRGIVVDKKKVKLKKYHDGNLETAFYKFYYLMLKAKLLGSNEYYIFLDKKPSRDKNVIRALLKFLEFHILKNEKQCRIKHLQSYDSDDNVLIQFSDFLTGLLGFCCNRNERDEKSFKASVVRYFEEKAGKQNLCSPSVLSEEKYNVFVWKADYEKN